MKIVEARAYLVEIPYKQTYVIAPGSVERARRVLVELTADGGQVGVGETGATVPERGGETPEAILSSLKQYFLPKIIGREAMDVAGAIDVVESSHWGRTGFLCAKAAIDNAMFDLVGKVFGCSVDHLLGGRFRTSVGVTRSLGVYSPQEVAAQAVARKNEGYQALTVKAGFDPREDIERLAAVREAVGPDFALEVDVNGGYTADVAVRTLTRMQDDYNIGAVEQPCPWWDLDGMSKVADALEIPVIADESVWTPQDVYQLARARAADVVCIKIIKNGGLYLSRKIAAVAEAVGMPVTLGSKHPLGPGTAAILHFAAAIPNVVEPIGYGNPLERLADDILVEDLKMQDGRMAVPTGVGLGVQIDKEKLQRYWVAGDPVSK